MDREAYEKLQKQTDELIKTTMMKELRGLKETNMLLFKVIGIMLVSCVGFVTYFGKDIIAKLDAYALSNNTVEIHQTILTKDVQKLEQRVDQIEKFIISIKKD